MECVCDCCIPVKIAVDTRQSAHELYWELKPAQAFLNEVYKDFSRYEHEYCLPPNSTFTFIASNTVGDGWHGGFTYFVDL